MHTMVKGEWLDGVLDQPTRFGLQLRSDVYLECAILALNGTYLRRGRRIILSLMINVYQPLFLVLSFSGIEKWPAGNNCSRDDTGNTVTFHREGEGEREAGREDGNLWIGRSVADSSHALVHLLQVDWYITL